MDRGVIRLEQVEKTYQMDEVFVHALRGVDLEVKKGEFLTIIGSSGSGKSTLVDLLPRFMDTRSGRILIDGVDIRELSLASLRSHIGLVTQHTFLFNDTVRGNIAYGGITQDMEAIIAAAKAAHAHEFISQLPDGYDTVIGELGMRLSGGQRQRLLLTTGALLSARTDARWASVNTLAARDPVEGADR